MFNTANSTILQFPAASVLAILVFVGTANAFEVSHVKNWADPDVYRGPCPATIKFVGEIGANGPGVVRYRWVRSDGTKSPVEVLEFQGKGNRTVSTDWTFTPAAGTTPWQVIEILNPGTSRLRYGKAVPKIVCEASGKSHARQDQSAPRSHKQKERTDKTLAQGIERKAPDPEKISESQTREQLPDLSTQPATRPGEAASRESRGVRATLQVGCPTENITASVVDRLPDGWWTTPQGGSLVTVYTMQLGGAPVLSCEYDANGRTVLVTRRFPPGYDRCYPKSGARVFVCEK